MAIVSKVDLYRMAEGLTMQLGQVIDIMLAATPLGEREHERLSEWSQQLDDMQSHCRDGVVEAAKWEALEPAKEK